MCAAGGNRPKGGAPLQSGTGPSRLSGGCPGSSSVRSLRDLRPAARLPVDPPPCRNSGQAGATGHRVPTAREQDDQRGRKQHEQASATPAMSKYPFSTRARVTGRRYGAPGSAETPPDLVEGRWPGHGAAELRQAWGHDARCQPPQFPGACPASAVPARGGRSPVGPADVTDGPAGPHAGGRSRAGSAGGPKHRALGHRARPGPACCSAAKPASPQAEFGVGPRD